MRTVQGAAGRRALRLMVRVMAVRLLLWIQA